MIAVTIITMSMIMRIMTIPGTGMIIMATITMVMAITGTFTPRRTIRATGLRSRSTWRSC